MHTKINWFEIPAANFDRSVKFYETVFDSKLQFSDLGGSPMGLFSDGNGEACGCVVHIAQHVAAENGTVIYLDASPSIDTVLGRIQPAGGRVVLEKTKLPSEHGYIAHFTDTEGNRLALHAMN